MTSSLLTDLGLHRRCATRWWFGNGSTGFDRTLVLRNLSGVVHIFPNGAITTLANATRTWSAYVFEVPIRLEQNIDTVISVMRKVGDQMQNNSPLGHYMIEPIEILGVDNFKDGTVYIKARIKTRPIRETKQVGREYRRLMLKTFAAEGLSISSPQLSLSADEKQPLLLKIWGEQTPSLESGSGSVARGLAKLRIETHQADSV